LVRLGNAHATCRLAHATFKNVAHPQLAVHLFDVDRPAFIGEARIARDYEQPSHPRERGDDVLDDAIRKILLFGIAAHILKGKHRDRRPVGKRQRGV
jgi:hypothetical protein